MLRMQTSEQPACMSRRWMRLITSTGEATIQRLRDAVKQDDDQSNKEPQ